MAWNPSPEVAVARDAAKALGDAPICIVLWMNNDYTQIGMASVGRTKALCEAAQHLGEHVLAAALEFDPGDML